MLRTKRFAALHAGAHLPQRDALGFAAGHGACSYLCMGIVRNGVAAISMTAWRNALAALALAFAATSLSGCGAVLEDAPLGGAPLGFSAHVRAKYSGRALQKKIAAREPLVRGYDPTLWVTTQGGYLTELGQVSELCANAEAIVSCEDASIVAVGGEPRIHMAYANIYEAEAIGDPPHEHEQWETRDERQGSSDGVFNFITGVIGNLIEAGFAGSHPSSDRAQGPTRDRPATLEAPPARRSAPGIDELNRDRKEAPPAKDQRRQAPPAKEPDSKEPGPLVR